MAGAAAAADAATSAQGEAAGATGEANDVGDSNDGGDASDAVDAGAHFPRRRRLMDGDSFEAVFDHRTRMHSQHFSAHAAPNALAHARLGLSVSRKISKKAVQRNRVKRVIRDSFRRYCAELGATDFVVVAKTGAADADSRRLFAELAHLWFRAARACRQP